MTHRTDKTVGRAMRLREGSFQRRALRCVAVIPLLLSLSLTAAADIKNCNGVWTNRECDAASQGGIPEVQYDAAQSEQAREQSRKQTILEGLLVRLSQARRMYGIDVVADDARHICEDRSTTLELCAAKIREIDTALAERLRLIPAPAATSAIEQGLPPDGPTLSSGGTAIAVTENNNYYVRPRRYPRQPYYRRPEPGPPMWREPRHWDIPPTPEATPESRPRSSALGVAGPADIAPGHRQGAGR